VGGDGRGGIVLMLFVVAEVEMKQESRIVYKGEPRVRADFKL
jgi:hypothetical protein